MNDLKQQAIDLGLCTPYQSEWKDDDNLVERYINGYAWCLAKQFPSLEDMLPYKEELEENNVFNSKQDIDFLLTAETYILNECTGKVEINDWNVSSLYIARNSVIEADIKDNSILTIETYDTTNLRLKIAKDSKCTIWLYGNSCVQILSGDATIIDKR